jgi:hypothetical protein
MRPTPLPPRFRHNSKKNAIAMVVAAFVLASVLKTNQAFAVDKIYSSYVTKGEFEVEYARSTTLDNNHDKKNLQAHETELEYGLTDHIMSELNGYFEKQPDDNIKSQAVGFEGRYQFFGQGENWIDSGFLVTYNRVTHPDIDPDAIEAKLLLEKQWGQFLHRAKIGIEQEVGIHSQGGLLRIFME